MTMTIIRQLVGGVLFIVGIAWLPYAWHARLAERWYGGDPELQTKLGNGLAVWMSDGLDRDDFTTGSKQFDGEWLYGTYVMAAMGFGQLAMEQPEQRGRWLVLMEEAIDQVLSDRVRAFDTERWGSDALETLDTDEGHAAYLGYVNLAMGFHRLLKPDSKFAELNDDITEALRRRIAGSPIMMIESYPHETYPVDNCAVIASVAINGDKHLGTRWAAQCRAKYIDAYSGLLYQSVERQRGLPYDYPRGSGTTLGLYFLSFMDPELSGELYDAVKKELAGSVFGFGLVREYPRAVKGQNGDIDSGAVIFGYGLSPTGFALGGARIHGDRDYFKHLYATAHAAGAPLETDTRFSFVTGASLGDAILFAMLTAQPGGIEELKQ